jgi:hypothetical protein
MNNDPVQSGNARLFTAGDYTSLKTAIRLCYADIGALKSIVGYLRVKSTSLLSDYANREKPEFPPLDVAMDLDALSGGDRILKQWAEVRGYRLMREEKGVAIENMMRHVGAIGQAFGALHAATCEALADGQVTPAEASNIIPLNCSADEALRNNRDDLHRIIAAKS